MLTNRRPKLMVGAALVTVVLVVVLTINVAGSANKVNRPVVGMGDVHQFEALQATTPNTEALFSDHPYVGMGDLHYYESLQEMPNP
jgi:hypothetical protein